MLNLDRCHQTTFKLICIVAILILSGCAAGSGGSLRASDLKENGDHVAMQASADASEAVIQSDAKIIEERLADYAGDGNYRMDVTLPEKTGGPGRIDIYLDPKLKGQEALSFTSRVFVSGNLRYSLYSIKNGFLAEREGTYLDLEPEDIEQAELTREYPGELALSSWNQVTAVKICLSDRFLAEHGETLRGWDEGIGLIADIQDRNYREYEQSIAIDNMFLKPADDPKTYYIINMSLTEREKEHIIKNLRKPPLAGSYEVSVRSAADWDRIGPDPDEFEHLCTHSELLSLRKEIVSFTLLQDDTDMDEEVRKELLKGLALRMEALGSPYCLGEITGQKGTVVVETLPDHINDEIIRILQIAAPLNLAANVYRMPLEGGRYEAKVVTLENGDLALDLFLSSGGKDSLQKMTAAQKKWGGGSTVIYLNRKEPICGAAAQNTINDGHLIMDRNYTGIGGDTWNDDNRWILDLLCAVINSPSYPSEKVHDFLEGYYYEMVFRRGEYSQIDSEGVLSVPVSSGFTDKTVTAQALEELVQISPSSKFNEKSEFDREYGIFNIQLGLKESQEELTEKAADYLTEVYRIIMTGPILNARVYLTDNSGAAYCMYTFWEDGEIKVELNSDLTEEYMSQSLSRYNRDNPEAFFLSTGISRLMDRIKEYLR